jgi:hypothetical protein
VILGVLRNTAAWAKIIIRHQLKKMLVAEGIHFISKSLTGKQIPGKYKVRVL